MEFWRGASDNGQNELILLGRSVHQAKIKRIGGVGRPAARRYGGNQYRGGVGEDSNPKKEEEAEVQEIRERKKTMRTFSMVNKSQNAPHMPRAIRSKRKDMHNQER